MKTKIKLSATIVLSITLFFANCKIDEKEAPIDNPLLEELVLKDQEIRNENNNDPMEPHDRIHRQRVMELLANNQVVTSNDKFNAALILQHTALLYCNNELKSISPENYFLAYTLAKSSYDSGNEGAAYLVAATYDRFLVYTEGYQKYGTQQIYYEDIDKMLWAPIDTLTTDVERRKYGVKPLAELLKESKMKSLTNYN